MFPTGVHLLDKVLGGGLPNGLVEVCGPASLGKTLLAFSLFRESSRRGQRVLYASSEDVVDDRVLSSYAPEAVYLEATHAEALFEAIYEAIDGFDVVCIDSLNPLLPLIEVGTPVGQRYPNAQQRLMYHCLRRLRTRLDNKLLLVISQPRHDLVGKRPKSPYLKHLKNVLDLSLKVRQLKSLTEYGKTVYRKLEYSVVWSPRIPPGTKADGYLFTPEGFNPPLELFRRLENEKIVERRGAYWKGDGITLGPGRLTAAAQICEEIEFYEQLVNISTEE